MADSSKFGVEGRWFNSVQRVNSASGLVRLQQRVGHVADTRDTRDTRESWVVRSERSSTGRGEARRRLLIIP